MADDPDNLKLRLLREIRDKMTTKDELDSKLNSLRADVASDMVLMRKELGEQIVGLRRAVVEYHSTTVGHGILISELEARVRRVEQHLNLPPLATH
jgi:signal transduction histidine kinase